MSFVTGNQPDGTPTWWNVYFATGDCDATVARVMNAGGTVVVAPFEKMDHGRMAIARDPVGAQFSLWQGRAPSSWTTLFEVADTDAAVARAAEAGGTPGTPEDFVYGRIATIADPFGTEFTVGARPEAQPG
jgi:predicted enzyme related to lactoylglutathione lyase